MAEERLFWAITRLNAVLTTPGNVITRNEPSQRHKQTALRHIRMELPVLDKSRGIRLHKQLSAGQGFVLVGCR